MGLARVIIRRISGLDPNVKRAMTEQIDRLAAVSRVLFEQRILDLQNEKLALQKRVAELEFGDTVLNQLLSEVNDTGMTEVCKCPGCYCSKRFAEVEPEEIMRRLAKVNVNGEHDWDNYPECILRKCLIWQCERLGLTHEVYKASDDDDDIDWSAHNIMEVWQGLARQKNCHIVVVDKGCGSWAVAYGGRLMEPGLFGNPDMDKLESLFELVKDGEEFFKVDGQDYFKLADDEPTSDFAV